MGQGTIVAFAAGAERAPSDRLLLRCCGHDDAMAFKHAIAEERCDPATKLSAVNKLAKELCTLKQFLLLPPLITLFVKISRAVATTHIACGEPFKALMAVRTTLFPIIFLDPWRIEPEVCHGPPKSKLNISLTM